MDAKSSSTSIPPHGPTIHLKATDVSSPTKSQAENEGSPIDAHLTQTKPSSPTELSSSSAELPSVRTAPPAISDSKLPTVAQNRSPSVLQTSDSESSLPSSSSLVPNLSKCQDVRYECRDCVPGASYKSADSRDEWTPVIKRKRRSAMKNLESESSESDSEVDVLCSRKVEYGKRDVIPGLSTEEDHLNGLQFTQKDVKNPLLPGLDRKLSTLCRGHCLVSASMLLQLS